MQEFTVVLRVTVFKAGHDAANAGTSIGGRSESRNRYYCHDA